MRSSRIRRQVKLSEQLWPDWLTYSGSFRYEELRDKLHSKRRRNGIRRADALKAIHDTFENVYHMSKAPREGLTVNAQRVYLSLLKGVGTLYRRK